MAEPRIGVFVCHCGRNIGGYVDVPGLVAYARGLPDVVHTEDNLYTCSQDGISSIKKQIIEMNLNRVVVAACSPTTHEPLFRAACEEAGINKYLFEFVNIRDQCSWVHMDTPETATAKAATLIRMGVQRARLLEPLAEIEIKVTPSCLVIGGGIAGMSAALNLANQGFSVHLVEREAHLGGMIPNLNRLFTDNRDAGELINTVINDVSNHARIAAHLKTKVEEVAGFIGNFTVTIDGSGADNKIDVGTIIVATGAEEFKPTGQYGYGKMSGVLTQLELEEQMKQGIFKGQNIVIVNCVGARVPERPYCSRFCCLTAIKNAVLIKENNPPANVWLLHRDIMAFGTEFEDCYRRAMAAGVRFVRYNLERSPQVVGKGKVKAVKIYHELRRRELVLPADTVVLTTPLVPNRDNEALSRLLKVPLGEHGFFLEAHLKLQPVEFATEGIYLCGCAKWPVEIPEAISQACASAAKAAIPMRRGYIRPEAITASVNQVICSGCGTCVTVCPYGAMELSSEGSRKVAGNITALCKGCGTCAAACPAGVITMNHCKDEQIVAQIEALAE
ncbi:CoB--CoM heterodisulfide reductase iron-sulfur subunit A family protein [Chloroflexota bacterium]